MKRKHVATAVAVCAAALLILLGVGCANSKTNGKEDNSSTEDITTEESGKQANADSDVQAESAETKPQEEDIEKDKEQAAQEPDNAVAGNRNELIQIMNNTGSGIHGSMEQGEFGVTSSTAVQEQLMQELQQGSYTLQDPMVIVNPYQNSPLTAVVLYTGSEEAKVRVTVKGKEEEQDISDELEPVKEHMIPVIGLYSEYDNEVLIEELDEQGQVAASSTVRIQTDALPDTLQGVAAVEKKTAVSAYPLYVVTGMKTPYVYALDSNADIRWYLTMEGKNYGVYPLTNGHFLMEDSNTMVATTHKPNSNQLHEIDLLGRVYQSYFFPNGVHHDIQEKEPDGNFLVVSNSGNGYEQDLIQEIDRRTGEIIKEVDFKKVFEGLSYIDKSDWAHINTVSYQKETDSVLVSIRNLHAGVKINWRTDEIMWILGNSEFFQGSGYEKYVLKPEGDIKWHYQQHTVYQLNEDLDQNPDTVHVMLYDNHFDKNRKVDYFDDTGSSYVKLYTINEKTLAVTQDKSFEHTFSKITSNFIFNYEKNRVFAVSATVDSKNEGVGGRIVEYDFNSGELLNQFSISHNFYRAYPLTVDAQSCLIESEASGIYAKGELRVPYAAEEDVQLPSGESDESLQNSISMQLMQGILYVNAPELCYTKLLFAGDEHTYIYDISDFGTKKKNDYSYAVPVPLHSLEPGEYQIYFMQEDGGFSLNQTVTIEN